MADGVDRRELLQAGGAMTAAIATQAAAAAPARAQPRPDARQRRIQLPITLPPGPWDVPVTIATTLYLPPEVATGTPVLFLFPGGGGSRGYFDIHVAGLSGYSQAESHAAHGFVAVAIDHLGTGESSLPPNSQLISPPATAANPRFNVPGRFTLEMMAQANDAAVRAIMALLTEGRPQHGIGRLPIGPAIGMGHSLGGHVLAVTQAAHATFAGTGFFGTSFTQTHLQLKPGFQYPARNAPPPALLLSSGHMDGTATGLFGEEERAIADVIRDPHAPWRTPFTPVDGVRPVHPLAFAREAASIRCPVLLGYGQRDVTVEPTTDLGVFRSSADLSLYVVERMGHVHNAAPTRARHWRRFEQFARQAATA